MSRPHSHSGFTLVELMITLAIAAIVITVGVPSLNDFVSAQRVRGVASDLATDMAFARAQAITESRWVIMEPIGGAGTWKDGWRIWVDLNNNRTFDDAPPPAPPLELRKTGTGISGRSKVCAVGSVDARIVFRPDGRAYSALTLVGPPGVTAIVPITSAEGIRLSDDFGDADASNDRIRLVYIGISGRPSVAIQDGGAEGGTPCP